MATDTKVGTLTQPTRFIKNAHNLASLGAGDEGLQAL